MFNLKFTHFIIFIIYLYLFFLEKFLKSKKTQNNDYQALIFLLTLYFISHLNYIRHVSKSFWERRFWR